MEDYKSIVKMDCDALERDMDILYQTIAQYKANRLSSVAISVKQYHYMNMYLKLYTHLYCNEKMEEHDALDKAIELATMYAKEACAAARHKVIIDYLNNHRQEVDYLLPVL